MTRPLTTVPSRPLLATPSDSSSSAAKLSFAEVALPRVFVILDPSLGGHAVACIAASRRRRGASRLRERQAARTPASASSDRRVDDVIGVGWRPPSGARPAPAVARVAFLQILQDIVVYSRGAAAPQLLDPPRGARLGAGGDEQLHDPRPGTRPCRCRGRRAPRRAPAPAGARRNRAARPSSARADLRDRGDHRGGRRRPPRRAAAGRRAARGSTRRAAASAAAGSAGSPAASSTSSAVAR